jgi:hypothetical protein
MERGIVVYDGKNPTNERQRLVVVSGKMSIRGEDFFVTAGLRDDAQGTLFYDHELLEVERADGLSSQSGRNAVSSTTGPAPTSAAHLNDYTIDFLGQDASVLEARARGFGPVDIHSPAFKAWFGDWEDGIRRAGVSVQAGRGNDNRRVQITGRLDSADRGGFGRVGEDGAPKVYYHGTKDDIEAFDLEHPNRKDKGWLGRGV